VSAVRLLANSRAIIWICLALLIALAWFYTLGAALGPQAGFAAPWMAMPARGAWTGTDLLLTFLMWAVMMIAMMVPTAAPMVMMLAKIEEKHGPRAIRTSLFLTAYVAVWAVFSVVATLLQWALHDVGLLSGAMGSALPWLAAAILILAGLYQLTPLKSACLKQCQSPIVFLARHARPGARGAVMLGLRYGLYCLGCCWALMAVLFAAGIMAVPWIAALSIQVLIEKTAPGGQWFGRAAGAGLVVYGVWLAAGVVG
jgi:predicted metal-binding membrane protein